MNMHEKRIPENSGSPYLAVVADEPLIAGFSLLLQQGVKVRSRIGCSVAVFLREVIGAAPQTIEKIQSIMLDGKPVDDIGAAMIRDGSVLALSAAMPGLVGATLRRGGAYSSFRSAITYQEAAAACAAGEGWVNVKVFNLLMAELGPGLLWTGVLVRSVDLFGFIAERSEDLGRGCRSVTLDGRAISISILRDGAWLSGTDHVFLSVSASPANI